MGGGGVCGIAGGTGGDAVSEGGDVVRLPELTPAFPRVMPAWLLLLLLRSHSKSGAWYESLTERAGAGNGPLNRLWLA